MIGWLFGSRAAALALTLPIMLVPCGQVPEEILAYLEQGLERVFHARVSRQKPLPVPEAAYQAGRGQYQAERVLEHLCPTSPPPQTLTLIVTGVDLYVMPLNFVFGLADTKKGAAIISLARLMPEYYGHPANLHLWQERALKEAVHEIGHLLGLGHCPKPSCIMFFSNTLSDTDFKGPEFCPTCRGRLRAQFPRP